MSKTIEDAASEYYLNEVINGDSQDDRDGWTGCFIAGASHVLSLPLSERLTVAEKATLLIIYAEWKTIDMDDSPFVPAQRIDEASAKIELLESIFGKEMFESKP